MRQLLILGIYLHTIALGFAQNAVCTRAAQTGNGGEMIVEVTINKGNNTGFGKIEESLSPGFAASSIDNKSAVFSFVDQKVKFLWMNMPKDGQFKVKYKVKLAGKTATAKACEIRGTFSYIDNETTMKVNITNSTTSPAIQSTEEPIASKAANGKKKEETKAKQNEAANAKPADSKGRASNNTSKPDNTTGIRYRVQIGAFHHEVSKANFKSVPDLDKIVREDGIIDYVSGNFSKYNEAVTRRDKLKPKFKDCFVVAIKDGKRVSLESLGINPK